MIEKVILIIVCLIVNPSEQSYFTSVKNIDRLVDIDLKLFETILHLSTKSKDDFFLGLNAN